MLTLKKESHVFKALENKSFFKLICGASFTDNVLVENLSFIFTLAGAHVIDLAPHADIVIAAKNGVEKAIEFGKKDKRFKYNLKPPILMASIQLDLDPHFRKVEVDRNLCDVCGACVKVCPTEAFKINENEGVKDFIYNKERCYGCGICPSYCHVKALNMTEVEMDPYNTLNDMLLLGLKSIEFHFGKNYLRIREIWDKIKDLVKKLELVSFSLGSGLLSDIEIKDAARLCFELAGSNIILQCDGVPMSGGRSNAGKNGHNNDELSLHVAKLIEEEKLPVFLQIAGGTTEFSFDNVKNSGLPVNGIAVGSYARKLLIPYLNDIYSDQNFSSAFRIARSLVQSSAVSGNYN